MSRSTVPLVLLSFGLLGQAGCVSVDTPDTKVHVGVTQVNLPGGSENSDPNASPYAGPLKRVTAQQAKVAKELAKGDWEELTDEAGDWITYTRELTGYAATSHDPALFRACCDDVSRHAEAIRQAALRRDAATARTAVAACDAPLNRLVRSFPLTRGPGQAVIASPAPAALPPAQPSHSGVRRPQVP
jgi:hypothetical protein